MNNRVAKKLKKIVYKGEKEEPAHDRGYSELFGGIIVCTGQRPIYKKLKKEYYKTKKLPSG